MFICFITEIMSVTSTGSRSAPGSSSLSMDTEDEEINPEHITTVHQNLQENDPSKSDMVLYSWLYSLVT